MSYFIAIYSVRLFQVAIYITFPFLWLDKSFFKLKAVSMPFFCFSTEINKYLWWQLFRKSHYIDELITSNSTMFQKLNKCNLFLCILHPNLVHLLKNYAKWPSMKSWWSILLNIKRCNLWGTFKENHLSNTSIIKTYKKKCLGYILNV